MTSPTHPVPDTDAVAKPNTDAGVEAGNGKPPTGDPKPPKD